MSDRIRRVILVGHDNDGSRDIFTTVVESHPDVEFALIITTGLYYKRSVFASVLKMLKEASFRFCLRRFIDLLRYRMRGDTMCGRAGKKGIDVYFTDDVNGAGAHDFIRRFEPDLLLSMMTMQIHDRVTIGLPRVAAIGCHPAVLPDYRGLEVFFWALANRERESGVSVFHLDEKIDSGRVIKQERFPIDDGETVESIYRKGIAACGRLMAETVGDFKRGAQFPPVKPAERERYFPMPTSEAYSRFAAAGGRWR